MNREDVIRALKTLRDRKGDKHDIARRFEAIQSVEDFTNSEAGERKVGGKEDETLCGKGD
jgi:hypothetical protein